jgi:hypothetical protein
MTSGWNEAAEFNKIYVQKQLERQRTASTATASNSPTPATWRSAMQGPQVYRAPSELTGWVNTSTLQGIERVSNPFSGFYTKPISLEEGINDFYNIYYGGNSQVRMALDAIAKRQRSTPKGIWEDMVYLSQMGAAEGVYMTAMDHLYRVYTDYDSIGGSSGGYRSYGGYGYGGGGGGGSSSSVVLTNPTSARGLLMQTMQSVLGRDPDEGEYKAFLEALNEAERANPRTVEMEGNTAVQSGGVDPGMIAMEYVEGAEEFSSAEGQRVFAEFMKVLGA